MSFFFLVSLMCSCFASAEHYSSLISFSVALSFDYLCRVHHHCHFMFKVMLQRFLCKPVDKYITSSLRPCTIILTKFVCMGFWWEWAVGESTRLLIVDELLYAVLHPAGHISLLDISSGCDALAFGLCLLTQRCILPPFSLSRMVVTGDIACCASLRLPSELTLWICFIHLINLPNFQGMSLECICMYLFIITSVTVPSVVLTIVKGCHIDIR